MRGIIDESKDGISKRETVCTKISYIDEKLVREVSKSLDLNKSQVLRGALRLLFIKLGYDVPLDAEVKRILEEIEKRQVSEKSPASANA